MTEPLAEDLSSMTSAITLVSAHRSALRTNESTYFECDPLASASHAGRVKRVNVFDRPRLEQARSPRLSGIGRANAGAPLPPLTHTPAPGGPDQQIPPGRLALAAEPA